MLDGVIPLIGLMVEDQLRETKTDGGYLGAVPKGAIRLPELSRVLKMRGLMSSPSEAELSLMTRHPNVGMSRGVNSKITLGHPLLSSPDYDVSEDWTGIPLVARRQSDDNCGCRVEIQLANEVADASASPTVPKGQAIWYSPMVFLGGADQRTAHRACRTGIAS